MKSFKSLELERQELFDKLSKLDKVLDAYRVIQEYETGNSNTVNEMQKYVTQHLDTFQTRRVMNAVNSSEGTDIKSVNGLIQGIKDPNVTDRILQYAWKIRIERGEVSNSTVMKSLKETVDRMENRGTLGGENLIWFQNQIESIAF